MTIILQEYEDIIKEAESIQEKVNTRVPEENEREEIMKLYAKAEKKWTKGIYEALERKLRRTKETI